MSHIYVNYPMAEKNKLAELLLLEEGAIPAYSFFSDTGICGMEDMARRAVIVYHTTPTSYLCVMT